MKKICITLVVLLTSLFGTAQDFSRDLSAVISAFAESESLAMDVKVKSWHDGQAQRLNVSFKRQGDQLYYRYDDLEFLLNKKASVMVDGTSKEITYTKNPGETDLGAAQAPSPADLKALMSSDVDIKYIGITNGRKHYQVNMPGVIRRYDLYFDAGEPVLRRVVYHYRTNLSGGQEKVEIDYTQVKYNAKFSSQEFSEKRFVKQSGNRVSGQGKYAGYQVSVQSQP